MPEEVTEAVCADCGVVEEVGRDTQNTANKEAAKAAGEHYEECGSKTWVEPAS
jgi:hypothetical protein